MSGTESTISSASSADFGCDTFESPPGTIRHQGHEPRSAAGDVLSNDKDEAQVSTPESQSLNGLDWISTRAPPDVFHSAEHFSLECDELQAEGRASYFPDLDQGEQASNPDDEDLVVLAPDHPLLTNFHRSVFQHLSKQKEQLANQIKEMATQVKSHRRESDEIAETLFDVQQSVSRQHAQLDLKTDNAAVTTELRNELEQFMAQFFEKHRREAKLLQEAHLCEEKLWHKLREKTEKDSTQRKREEDTESKLVLLKRQTEKASIDKKQLMEEKKQQDEFVYKLSEQVTDLQVLLAQLNKQRDSKLQENAHLLKAVKAAGLDIEKQSLEHHRLDQIWQRLLVTAKIKDTEYTQLHNKKQQLQEAFKIAENASKEHSKGEEQEREKNGKLVVTFQNLKREKTRLEMQISKEQTRISTLQEQMEKINNMIGVNEINLKETRRGNRAKEARKSFLENECAGLLNIQLEVERKIFEALNEKTLQDKSVQQLIKRVDNMQNLNEELEKERIQKDLNLAHAQLEVQKLKHEEAQMKEYLNQQINAATTAQSEISSTEHELQLAKKELAVKQGKLNQLNIKLAMHLEKIEGKEMGPLETKIVKLEDNIKSTTSQTEATQRMLLRKEVILMDKNEKLYKMKNEVGHLQKSIEDLQHKSRGQVKELESQHTKSAVAYKKMNNESLALESVDREISNLRHSKATIEKEYLLQFNEIQQNMRADEEKAMELSEKLIELGEENKHLYNTLRLLQTEQVDLEAKLTLANDTKRAIDHERGTHGEIAAMKSEIHRMEVRLGQLKKTQEKLKIDLDQCVLRRDLMVDAAQVRNTKHSVSNTARLKSLRRFETAKHNNRQLKSKLEKYDSDRRSMRAVDQEICHLRDELDKKNTDTILISEAMKSFSARLSVLKSLKRENLDQLVHEQKNVRGLSDAKDNKYKTVCKTESSLTNEAEKQKVVHSNLISIIESLRPSFPQYATQLQSIASLLKCIKVRYPSLSATPSVQDDASSVQ